MLTILVSAAVLVGWFWDIEVLKKGLPGFVTMKANTALIFLLFGAMNWHMRDGIRGRWQSYGLLAFAGFCMAISLGTLVEYAAARSFGIDELLFLDPEGLKGAFPPGRPAPVTAINFILMALGVAASVNPWRQQPRTSQVLLLMAFLIGVQALVGYVCGISYSFGSAFYTQMAIQTALLFTLSCVGLLLTQSDQAYMKLLTAQSPAGSMARQLTAAAVVVPPVINWLQLQGQRLSLFDADFGVLMRVMGNVGYFIVLVLRNSVALDRAESHRRLAEDELRNTNRQLDDKVHKIEERTQALHNVLQRAESEAMERLRSESHLRLITDAVPALVAYVDLEFRYKFVNKSYETWFGLAKAELLGKHMSFVVGEQAFAAGMERINRVLAGEAVHFERTVVYPRGGAREVYVSYVPDINEAGAVRGFVILVNDVTEKKKAEASRLKLSTTAVAAEEASRLKSQFLANMSHEIRTPINGVLGMTTLLLDTPLTTEGRDFAETIRRSADSLLAIVNDVLDFSKIEAGKLDLETIDFELTSTLRDLEKMFAHTFKQAQLKLVVDIDPNLPVYVRGDPSRLRQVLVNLIGNAAKFTKAGSVTVRAYLTTNHDARTGVRFEIIDTGIGIKPEQKATLFQAFTQADASTTRRFGGTGLGLSICSRLVELMGGEIGVESHSGQGSTFWFVVRFAVSDAVPTLTTSVLTSSSTEPQERLRILLAEDNAINQKIAIRFFEKLGHRVDAVGNGREAVDALRDASYDLVFMDCQMPEMDGYEATAQIRGGAAPGVEGIPIIAMTANAMKGDAERCLAAGMSDYVPKPIDFRRLEACLLRWSRALKGRNGQAA